MVFFREKEGKLSMLTLILKHVMSVQISYLSILRAVGRSAGTQPDQKTRIRQLVSSTILIFLVCFSPYHIFLLARTLLERECNFITGTLYFLQTSPLTQA